MFDDCKRAGLLPSDLAKLLKVNRVTVSMWFNGHNKPHFLLEQKVQKVLDAVTSALQAGDFPIPSDMPRVERGPYIQKVMVQHLRARATAA